MGESGGASKKAKKGGMIANFPEWFKPREIQQEIIGQIEERLASGYRTILLCAPTGVGKSLIGATFARNAEDSFTVTSSKHLQDQYIRDVPFLKPVKGKSNFPCLKIMKAEKIEADAEAMKKNMTCDRGTCKARVIEDGREVIKTCEFKPRLGDVAAGVHDDNECHYYSQKYEALTAPHSLWNYAMYFQTIRYGQNAFARYLDREAAIFDEAHRIEDEMVRFVGYTAYAGQMRECGIDPASCNYESVDSLISITDEMARALLEKRQKIRDEDPENVDAISKLDTQIDSAERIRNDLKEDPSNFVVADPEMDEKGEIKSIATYPVDVSRHADSLLKADVRMFMSATIDKTNLCQTLGITYSDVAMVDVPRSPFDLDHRRVTLMPVRRLNYLSTEQDELAVIKVIGNLMETHKAERGIILTSSVVRCHNIVNNLPKAHAARVRICHSNNRGGMTQAEVIEEHKADPHGVLLSSSLWEGVDLSDDQSRFQIIAKMPYPPLTDRRVKAKKEKFPLWYKSQTIKKFLQGLGRSVRGPEDWAATYVLDGSVESLLRSDHMIPRAYHDALKIGAYA
ncbi:MAG: DEAD/DEAH box helicase family protein [Alphaproteobacteria bacterium]|nr:DEAD/DEAH box helicase family protein [Alphaproteobacteria bacterium]MDA8029905.1 DEAD/DEAH box helicase family protein [Alphaproteobacteria bacterium]